ncbi:hypothetical protein [Rhizobium johnstonii]|uniref:hypothetical protein n=1 Tax=Rhizobium johnstonii TaxID=3019933 RepID=UPI003F9D8235
MNTPLATNNSAGERDPVAPKQADRVCLSGLRVPDAWLRGVEHSYLESAQIRERLQAGLNAYDEIVTTFRAADIARNHE